MHMAPSRPAAIRTSIGSTKLYWLDIDVALRNILRSRRTEPAKATGLQRLLSLEHCILEGVGAVTNALAVGHEPFEVDRFLVNIDSYTEVDTTSFELRSSARMIWNNLNERSLRLDIYLSRNLTNHLIELYVTKRIDRVQISIQIAVIGDYMENIPPEGFPLLGETGRLHFRRMH